MKIKPFNIFALLMLIVLHISIAITMIYAFNCKEVEKASNTLYDENALTFTTSKVEFTVDRLKKEMPNNSVIFSQMLGNENVRGMCYKGYYERPKLKSGRFFTTEDFDGEKKAAVIGCDISTEKENGKEFINYHNEKYFVIGIIGYPIPSRLDSMVFLSLNDDLLKQPIEEYVISGKQLQENLNFLGNENMLGQVTVFERHEPNLLHIISSGKSQNITIALFFICIIFNSYLVFYFFIEKEKSAYAIKIMIGYTIRRIRNEEIKKLLFINICVIVIGSALVFGFTHKWMFINIGILGMSGIIYLGVSLALFFILLHAKLLCLGKHGRKERIE